ncbi:MAG: cache domain-containing protein [Thermodesulfobacteriota bacterium]
MRKKIFHIGILILVGVLILSSQEPSASSGVQSEDAKQIMALVDEAASLLQSKGTEAFNEFRKKDSKWLTGVTYVFVFDLNGVLLFHPLTPDSEGKSIIDLKDVNGKAYIQEMIETAKTKGSGWMEIMSSELGENKPSEKSSYFRKVKAGEEELIVGSGFHTDWKQYIDLAETRPILKRMLETYRNMRSYHFERQIVIEESETGKKPKKVGELTLVTASEETKPLTSSGGFGSLPFYVDRFRWETKTRDSTHLLACDEQSCWAYDSESGEYMKGKVYRDVTTSVSGAMWRAFYLDLPFTAFLPEAKLVGEDTIEIGGERRLCYVIEATLKPASSPDLKEPKPSSPLTSFPKPSLHSIASFTLVQIFGFAYVGSESAYAPPWDTGEPLHLKMWVDKAQHIALRTNINSTWIKKQGKPLKKEEETGEKVEIEFVDTFTVTKVDESLPDELFKFTPPPYAKEVPSFETKRREGYGKWRHEHREESK